MDKYITPTELREIADFCDSLIPLWEMLTKPVKRELSVDSTESPNLDVYDSNGDMLGTISWADSGPAFYPVIK